MVNAIIKANTYNIKTQEELDMWNHIKDTIESANFLVSSNKLDDEELAWLYKRHEELYEPGWYSVDPLSSKQIQIIMLNHIKKNIKADVSS